MIMNPTPPTIDAPERREALEQALAWAYIKGAEDVHAYWKAYPGEAPRGDQEFDEAASDYAKAALDLYSSAARVPDELLTASSGERERALEEADRLRSQYAKAGCFDPGIAGAVQILQANGIETFESCEGGLGHAYAEPTVCFHGQTAAGWKAVSVCLDFGLPVMTLHRRWSIERGEPTGPYWEIVFRELVPAREEFPPTPATVEEPKV